MAVNPLATIDELRLALRPFETILRTLDDLAPLASKKQAVGEVEAALASRKRDLEDTINQIETLKVQANESLEVSHQEAIRLVNEAKEQARLLVEKAKYKLDTADNEIERRVKEMEEIAVELSSRVESLKKEEASLVKSVGELGVKEDKVKAAIRKLAEV